MAARSGAGRRARERVIRVGREVRFDAGRPARTGVPEIILAEGKSAGQLVALLRGLHRRRQGALISRISASQRRRLRGEMRHGLPLRFARRGSLARLAGDLGAPAIGGTAAIVSAGTADVRVADEAESILRALGIRTVVAHDVGVAGLHRLQRALLRLERARPSVYLVFAGREGALPTVLAGLVGAPVVGVPTSVGYGRGGRGEAALTAMLQSCAPIAVVNIDAAVPAALFAAKLVRRSLPR
ncbi:MAG: nickel pincer cofactor biosynthesis protein LarB [Thermoplasmata archaeon]|nr:nickel pincer cofactor biosynthesis protein LarB [Thermoplasmata archaeon]